MARKLSKVIKTRYSELDNIAEPRIYGLKICQEGDGSYCFSVKHTGGFRLQDYDEIEFKVKSATFVKRQ